MSQTLKVVIIGGGVAGCSAAIFLHELLPKVSIEIYEAYATAPESSVGGGLGLASNGLCTLALVAPDAADDIYARSKKCAYYEMHAASSRSGSVLGRFPAGGEKPGRKYGTVLTRRWTIHDALLNAMQRRGLNVVYGRRAVEIIENDKRVEVVFEDGTAAWADLLIGADGIHSIVRRVVAPSAASVFSGLIGLGGFVPRTKLDRALDEEMFPLCPGQAEQKGAIMVLGPLGFFGIALVDELSREQGGELMWWSTFETEEKTREEWKKISAEDMKSELLKRHGNWQAPIPELIETLSTVQIFPNYELADLTTWHTRRTVLVGDAAHVVPPHSGQGVSQAIEDSAALALALKKALVSIQERKDDQIPASLLESALTKFQERRKPRVDKILKSSRKIGNTKREKSALETFITNWVMKLFLVLIPKSVMDQMYNCQFSADEFL